MSHSQGRGQPSRFLVVSCEPTIVSIHAHEEYGKRERVVSGRHVEIRLESRQSRIADIASAFDSALQRMSRAQESILPDSPIQEGNQVQQREDGQQAVIDLEASTRKRVN